MFGKRKQQREAAHKAWVLGGTMAFETLSDAMPDDAVLLPDSSQQGGDALLRLVSSKEDPIGNTAMEIAHMLKYDDSRSPVEKRLTYRQAVLAASLLTGTEKSLDVARNMEDELLGLDENES